MLSDLAFALAKSGNNISIITSRQLYDSPETRLPSRETVAGVSVHRMWTSHFGRHNLLGRAIDYLTFYLSAAWTLWRVSRRGDVIVAKTDPPMLSAVTAPIARIRRAKLVNWLQDLFPEVLEALDVDRKSMRRMAYKFMRSLRNRSLRYARMNIVIGERMAERLARFDVPLERIRIIPNWADGAFVMPCPHAANPLRREWGLEGKFVIGYSGNLGRAHEFDTLMKAIAHLEKDRKAIPVARNVVAQNDNASRPAVISADTSPPTRDVVWLFIGGGALYRRLQAEVAARGFISVQFRPYQPREHLAESLSAPDVHLVSLRPELEGLIVPSKYYGIAAVGRPAIFVGDADGEIARILEAEAVGRTVMPGDGAGLAALVRTFVANPTLTQEMGRRARSAFERGFDIPVAVAAWEKTLAAVQHDLLEAVRDRAQWPGSFTQDQRTTKDHKPSTPGPQSKLSRSNS